MLDGKKIGERLRKLRGNKSGVKVAKDCGISSSALYMYELGLRIPNDNIKIVLAAYYKRSVQSIFFKR